MQQLTPLPEISGQEGDSARPEPQWAVAEGWNVQPDTCTLELCSRTYRLLFLFSRGLASSSHLFNFLPLSKLNLLAWGYWTEGGTCRVKATSYLVGGSEYLCGKTEPQSSLLEQGPDSVILNRVCVWGITDRINFPLPILEKGELR